MAIMSKLISYPTSEGDIYIDHIYAKGDTTTGYCLKITLALLPYPWKIYV